jgi:anti-anti-sigma factor
MKINTTIDQGSRIAVTVLHVEGSIDSATYDTFYHYVEKAIADGARHVLIDLTHTPFVSSAGLRSLHRIVNLLRSLQPDQQHDDAEIRKMIAAGQYKSPHLKLLNLSPETKTSFELSGFNLFIEAFTDMQAALASF